MDNTMTIDEMLQQGVEGNVSKNTNTMTIGDMLAVDTTKKVKVGMFDYLSAAGQGISKAIGSAPGLAGNLIKLYIDHASGKGASVEEIRNPKSWTDRLNPLHGISTLERLSRQKAFKNTDIDERISSFGERLSESNKLFIETGFPEQKTKALQFVEDLGAGGISLASAITMGMIAGPVAPGIAFGLAAKAGGYKEALDKGKTYNEARVISDYLGIFEGGLEFWGVHSIISSGGGIIKRTIKGMASEFIQEFSQTGAEGTIKKFSDVEEASVEQILSNSLYAGSLGFVLGGASALSVASAQKSQIKRTMLRAGFNEQEATVKTNELMNKASEAVLAETDKVLTTTYETRKKEARILTKIAAGEEITDKETEALNQLYQQYVDNGLIEAEKVAPSEDLKGKESIVEGKGEIKIDKDSISEGRGAIPGEPLHTYNKGQIGLFINEEGKYYLKREDGTFIYNSETKNALFDTVEQAEKQLSQPKGEVSQQDKVKQILKVQEPKDIQKKIDLLYQGREKQLDQRRLAIEKEMKLLEKQERTKSVQSKLDKLSEELESIHFQIADLEETGIARLEKEGITIKGEELERLRKKAFRQGEITLRKDLMAKIKVRREEKAQKIGVIKKILKQPKKPENIIDIEYQKKINAILEELGETKQLRKKSLQDIPVPHLIELAKRIADLKEAGKKVFKTKKEQSKMASEIMNAALIKQAGGTKSGMFAKGSVEEQKAKRASGIKKADINFLRPLRMIKRIFGQVGEELLYDSIGSASTIKNVNLLDRKAKINESRKKNKITYQNLGRTITLNSQSFSVNNILRMYLATKDEQSYKAVLSGNNISKEQVDNFINEVKKRYPKYITFAEEVQKIVGDRFDAIAKTMADIFNVEVEKVKVYFPLIRKAFNQRENLNEGIESEFVFEQVERKGVGFSYTSTNKDFTISRETMKDQFQTEISLDFMGDALRAIEKQEHLIAYAPLHKAFNKIIANKDIQDAVTYNHSEAAWKWLNDYLKVNINPDIMYQGGDLSRGIVRRVRLGLSKAYLGFNVVTAAKQFPSAVLALKYTTPQDIAISMTKIAVSKKARENVYKLDPDLRNRIVSRDYNDLLSEIGKLPNSDIKRALLIASKSIDKAAFTMIMQMDKFAVLSVYDAVYRHQKITKSEEEARNIAHKAVIDTQPQGGIKDLPQIYRTNNEFLRMSLMFTNQLNQIWNMVRADTAEDISKGQYAKATTGIASVMLSSTLIYLMSHGRLPEDPDDFIEAIFGTFVASIPIVGNYGMAYFRGFEASVSPAEAILKNINYTVKSIQSGKGIKVMENSLFLLAVIAQLPYSQFRRTIKGAIDITTGRTEDFRRLIWSEYMLENK